jgi:hypothetical protein
MPISCRMPEGNKPLSFGLGGLFVVLFESRYPSASQRITRDYLRLRAVLLRRVERDVLREAVRRFVPVLRCVVDLRPVDRRPVDFRDVDLRAVDLRAVALRAVDLRAVDLRPDDRRVVLRDEVFRPLVILRPVLLRPVVLRPAVLRPLVLRPLVFRPDDPVLPERSRRFVLARLRLFSDGLS